jgi:hypothetical protein
MGDFLGHHALGETLDHLAFARSEARDVLLLRHGRHLERFDEQAGNVPAERRTAFAGLADAGGDFIRPG